MRKILFDVMLQILSRWIKFLTKEDPKPSSQALISRSEGRSADCMNLNPCDLKLIEKFISEIVIYIFPSRRIDLVKFQQAKY